MKSILIIAFLTLLLVPSFVFNVDALMQVGIRTIMDIKPGETKTFQWGIKSDKSNGITSVELSAEREGSEFLSFIKNLEIEPQQVRFTTITVSIPDDYPGGIQLAPRMYATEVAGSIGGTALNVRVANQITLNVAPNDDPSLRVDWEALKKAQAEQTSPLESQPSTQEEQVDDQSQLTTGMQKESIAQEQDQQQTTTIRAPAEVEMDPEPGVDFDVILDPESQVLQIDPPEGGGCLIATATFGSELAPQVQMLRELRDNTILGTQSGTAFMTGFNQLYYSFSPTVADWERQNPAFQELVKITITPMLASLSILNYVDIDSEAQMLGWGLSIIALNLTMYVAAPTIGSYKMSKYLRNRK